jgi:hypothetical protein
VNGFDGQGGAINIQSTTTSTTVLGAFLTDLTFTNNYVAGYNGAGGAVCLYATNAVTASRLTFVGNQVIGASFTLFHPTYGKGFTPATPSPLRRTPQVTIATAAPSTFTRRRP